MLNNVKQTMRISFPRPRWGGDFKQAQDLLDTIQTMNVTQTLNFSILLIVLELVNLSGCLASGLERPFPSPMSMGIVFFILLMTGNVFYCEHLFKMERCQRTRLILRYHTYVFTGLFSLFCLFMNHLCLKSRITAEHVLMFYIYIAAGPFYSFPEAVTAIFLTAGLSIPSFLAQGAPAILYTNLFLYSFTSLFLSQVRFSIMGSNLRMLREARDEQVHLQDRADKDPLTHIPNRSCFSLHLDTLIPAAVRLQVPVAVIMVDIDYFKQYNDTYGHVAGDECLKKVASALAAHIHQERDLICRFGGEEFQIFLYGVRPGDAVQVADRLRQAVADLKLPSACSSASPYVTISVGGCCAVPSSLETYPRMVLAADDQLYHAKNHGKNMVSFSKLSPQKEQVHL